MKKCDIIIPIYNAYGCLKPCIESVINNTDLKKHRIILIDDKSPDKKVLPLLEEYANKYDSIILMKNEENLGFVKTVNKAMKFSDNDVLLLNSDTEVTKNWLNKIIDCAYSSDNIATVTPLSNNATMASVPYIFEANELPKDLTLSDMSAVVEEASLNFYPELATAHGFCMFIKRTVLFEVGYFDEENFPKGYGEENDFSFRCSQVGYKHVLCDNTYILHKESMSFKDSKIELINNSAKYLKKTYPENYYMNEDWCHKKIISYVGQNIVHYIGNKKNRPNILIIIHDWNPKQLGGTTMHAFDIVLELKKYFNFHVLAPDGDKYKLYSYYDGLESVMNFYDSIPYSFPKYNFSNTNYKIMIENIITMFSIKAVHIHHLIHHYFDLFEVVKKMNVYTMITLHDFYSICPLINFINHENDFCDGKTDCSKCLKKLFKDQVVSSVFISRWRNKWENVLSNVDLIITPSENAKSYFLKYYSNLSIKVIEHGVDYDKVESQLVVDHNDVFDIAFIGAIGDHKGAAVLKDMIKNRRGNNVRIHLFGITKYGKTLNSNKWYIDHGKYKREELPILLKKNNIKLVCLFSNWPETYAYTLTESIASGVPPLVFDIGAASDRVKQYKFGWTMNMTKDSDLVYKKINEIIKSNAEYSKVISNINSYKLKTTVEMNKSYKKLYVKTDDNKNSIDIDNVVGYVVNTSKMNREAAYPNYAWVFDTLKWKLISRFKIPRGIKRIFSTVKRGK